MKFGCCINLKSFLDEGQSAVTPHTMAAALEFLAHTGYDFAELPVGLAINPPEGNFRALVDVVQAGPVPALAFNCFIPAQLPLVGPARNLNQVRTYLAEVLMRINELGGKLVVFGSGTARNVPPGYSRESAQVELLEFLNLAADTALPYGITIVVEPLNKKESNIINTVVEGVALSTQVGPSNVMGLADTYHMDMEEEPVDVLIPYAKHLGHVHVADHGRRAPGLGAYDYSKLRLCLDEGGYRGRVSIECHWGDFKAEAPRALSVLHHAWA